MVFSLLHPKCSSTDMPEWIRHSTADNAPRSSGRRHGSVPGVILVLDIVFKRSSMNTRNEYA